MNNSEHADVAEQGVVARYTRAWFEGDLETLVDCYADNVVVHYGGQSPYAGTHYGKDRFLEVLAGTAAIGKRDLVSVDQLHDDGAWGAVFVTESFEIAGEVVTVQRALRYRIDRDLIKECWLFDMDQHLVDQAWTASEPLPLC